MKIKKFLVTIHEKNLDRTFEEDSKDKAIERFLEKFIDQIEVDDLLEIKERKFGGWETVRFHAKEHPSFHDKKKRSIQLTEERRLAAEREEEMKEQKLEDQRKKEKERKLAERREKDRKRRLERKKKNEEHEKFLQTLLDFENLLESDEQAAFMDFKVFLDNAFQVIDTNLSNTKISKKELEIRQRIYYKSLKNEALKAAIGAHQVELGRRALLSVVREIEDISKGIGTLGEGIGQGNKIRTTAALAGALFATEGIKAIREDADGEESGF